MQLIKIDKKANGKIEQTKTILSVFCLLSNIRLSETELTVLAYFLVYKDSDETRQLILKSELLKSEDSLNNTICKLNKFGLVRKSSSTKRYEVADRIKFQPDTVVGMIIRVDNK